MAKIKLGARPKSFPHTVTVPMPEGGTASVQMQFKYRTRSEFGAFVDNLVASARTEPPADQSAEAVLFSLKRALEQTLDTNAEYILQIAEGWNLDEPFNLASVRQFCDELPGAAMAVIEAYRAALTEGRLGN
jgi:hypothetical protein